MTQQQQHYYNNDPNKTDKAGRTKIFSSTSSGSLDKVKVLIERGANVNHVDNAGWTPIHEAALKGQYEIMKYLIQHGANINVRGFEDDTPLHDASSYGYADCVQLLIDHGANVFSLNSDKKKPIDLCQDKQCIKILKQKMKELNKLSQLDSQGKSILHKSCINGDIAKVQELLKIGVNINQIDNNEYTPMHFCCQHGHLDILKLLIQHGANINCLSSQNQSILHLSCQYNHSDIVDYLINNTNINVHLIDKNNKTSYQLSDSTHIRQIITAHIDQEKRLRATTEAIDEITFVSNTRAKKLKDTKILSREERKIQAIMKAFEKADEKAAASTEKKSTTSKKRKQRECSVESNHSHKSSTPSIPKKSTRPVDNRLDPFKKDTSGRTQLHKWSIRGNTEVVEELLNLGANPGETDNAGYTPLHEAALRGKEEVVVLLLDNKADVNCKGADLDTPLHDATENDFPNVVKILLDYHADVQLKNKKGQTALDIAIELENKEIERMLRQHVKPKKRKLVLAADLPSSKKNNDVLESPTSPKDLKAHARQLSGQHLPKKGFIKQETMPPDGPHTPIPTPPPEKWQKVKKEEDDFDIYPASRYLPLYTIQESDNNFFVVDLQISLLLGINLLKNYSHLYKRQIQDQEKERLWSPLSSMLCTNLSNREDERQKFLATDIYFVRLDQVVSLIKSDYSHLSESLITITLDIGYQSKLIKLPPKFALKMRKCNGNVLPKNFY